VLAAVELAGAPAPKSRSAAEREIKEAVKAVAAALGNTPAVCRASYIDPRLFERFREGSTIELDPLRNGALTQKGRGRIERAVLALVS